MCNTSIDDSDEVKEIHYTSLGLSYTSDDLVRRGPSGRMCIEDDERLSAHRLPIRVREDLFQEMPPLNNITVNDEPEVEIECIPPPLVDIIVVEDGDDDIQIIEPDIVYLKSIVNIDISKE